MHFILSICYCKKKSGKIEFKNTTVNKSMIKTLFFNQMSSITKYSKFTENLCKKFSQNELGVI